MTLKETEIPDFRTVIPEMHAKASGGDMHACFFLYHLYNEGENGGIRTVPNREHAARWYRNGMQAAKKDPTPGGW
jgi:hypothetical protein